MKKPASKVAKPAQIQPKSQFLFHKNLPTGDFSIMTLDISKTLANLIKSSFFLVLYAVWNKKDDTTEKKDAIEKFRQNFQMSKKQLLPVKTS